MLDRPSFKPHLHVEIIPREGLVLLSETDHVILSGPLYALVASYLDGRHSSAAIVAALSGQAESAEVRRILEDLERQGLLTEAPANGGAGEAAP